MTEKEGPAKWWIRPSGHNWWGFYRRQALQRYFSRINRAGQESWDELYEDVWEAGEQLWAEDQSYASANGGE